MTVASAERWCKMLKWHHVTRCPPCWFCCEVIRRKQTFFFFFPRQGKWNPCRLWFSFSHKMIWCFLSFLIENWTTWVFEQNKTSEVITTGSFLEIFMSCSCLNGLIEIILWGRPAFLYPPPHTHTVCSEFNQLNVFVSVISSTCCHFGFTHKPIWDVASWSEKHPVWWFKLCPFRAESARLVIS